MVVYHNIESVLLKSGLALLVNLIVFKSNIQSRMAYFLVYQIFVLIQDLIVRLN